MTFGHLPGAARLIREHFVALLQTYDLVPECNYPASAAFEILANTELRQRYCQQLEPASRRWKGLKTFPNEQIHLVDIPTTAVLTSIFIGLFFLDVLGDTMAHSNRDEIETAIAGLGYEGLAPRLPVE
jgi:hypothetical protein